MILRKSLPLVTLLLAFAGPAQASPHVGVGCFRAVTAKQAVGLAEVVWSPSKWKRGAPKDAVLAAHRHQVRCAKGPGHRAAIKHRWEVDRAAFYRHRRAMLAAWSIDYRWPAHWAPDWSGPTLPPYVIAALAEKAGETLGVDVPGWTMEQMTIGESGRRPGSAAVDPGGTRGYGLWAVTWPFSDPIIAKYGWSYDDMWNPVRNAVAMAEIYARQGLGAWYGNGYVTSTNAHYRGHFDLRLVLGGLTLRQALGPQR